MEPKRKKAKKETQAGVPKEEHSMENSDYVIQEIHPYAPISIFDHLAFSPYELRVAIA